MTRSDSGERAWRVAMALTLGMLCGTIAPPRAAAKKRPPQPLSMSSHWSGVPGGERVIEVYGVNGNIHATHSESESLIVDTVKRGRNSDPQEVQVSVEFTATGATVCARYPRPSGDLNDCGADQRIHDNDVMVDFTLQVPPGAKLIAHVVNGSIGGEDMQGPVEATTVNGGINVVSTHRVTASCVNGNIDVMMGPLAWAEPLAYTTTNGSVLLRIPPASNATLDARTNEGKVSCGVPLSATEHADPQRLLATLGKGGPRLRIETVKGNVEIMAP